jgi:hypothetical protein
MKKYLFLIVVLGFAAQGFAQQQPASQNGPVITFEKKTHDFGDIIMGKQNKVVTVVSNAANADGSQITFTANVLEKKGQTQ